MHVVPSAIRIVVVPIGVAVLLGLRNPPRSWTGMVGPSVPGFTIAPCVDSLLCYRLIKRINLSSGLSLSFKTILICLILKSLFIDVVE
jgi:hypothetical protein